MVKVFGLLSLLVLVAASCSSAGAPSGQSAIEVIDQLGRVVRLDKVPQRIVSLAPSNTEILFALGLGDKVAGVTTYDNFPAEAKEKPKVGGFSTPDLEKVVALAPDLVVAAPIHEKEAIPQLESRGLKVLALAPKTVTGVMQAIELMGKATGTEASARRLTEEMKARIGEVTTLVASLPAEAKPRVFYVLWYDPLMTVGPDTLQGQLIEMAGGKNLFADLASYPTVDLEVLLQRQPQLIIAGVGHAPSDDAPLQWAKSEARLKDTDALRQGRVFGIDADIVSRPGPRIIDALEEMLRLIHPELAAKLQS